MPVVVEDQLDRHEAADQVAGLGRDDGDRREEGVAEDVPADHRPPRQPLEDRRPRVVRIQRFHRARPRHARHVAEEDEDEAERRQDQVFDLREDACARRRLRGRREHVEPEPEDEDSHHRPDELGDGRGRETADGDGPVGRPPFVERGQDAAEDPERHDDQEGKQGELGRVPERRADHLLDRAAEGVRLAQVALEDPGHPVAVAEPGAAGRCRAPRSAPRRSRVPRTGPRMLRATSPGSTCAGDEDDHAQQPERDEGERDPPEDEASHGGPQVVLRISLRGPPGSRRSGPFRSARPRRRFFVAARW